MHLTSLLIGLWASSASALDIYFWDSSSCRGVGLVCSGINPGVCCLGGGGLDRSVSYLGIVQYWDITCQSSYGYNCNDPKSRSSVKGVTWVCHDEVVYDSAKYWFNGKKRRDDVCTGAEQPCHSASVKRADKLVFPDGATYDIGGLEESDWK